MTAVPSHKGPFLRQTSVLAHRVFETYNFDMLPRQQASPICLIFYSLIAPLSYSQSPPDPAALFDVATIKPGKLGTPLSIRAGLHGTFGTTNAPLLAIMTFAFGLKPFQIEGGPGWVRSQGFDIEAKIDQRENTTARDFQSRLRALLIDRFRLVTHVETTKRAVYALVQAKGGSTLQVTGNGDCVQPDMNAPLPPRKDNDPPPCSVPIVRRGRVDGAMMDVDVLRSILEDSLNRTVVNDTGMNGKNTVHLSWNPIDLQAGVETGAHVADAGTSLFSALEEQLGLKLVSRPGSVEVLTISHVEQPTGN
jgi:uncharacterized protein (TIGR03435 family)